MARLKLITFDAMNTLFELKNSVGREYGKVAAMYGLDTDHNPIHNKISLAFKSQWRLANEEHPNFGRETGLRSYKWWGLVVEKTLTEAGVDESMGLTEPMLAMITGHLYKRFSTSAPWVVKEGVTQALSGLRDKHPDIKLGIISNFDERLEPVLAQLGLRHWFDFVMASYLVKQAKPHKAVFDLALEEAGLKHDQGSEALHVGDNVQLDYVAAKESGWNALLVHGQSFMNDVKLNRVESRDVIETLDEILRQRILLKHN
jgi:REG-2-like HAD superfamily hydrolase